MREYRHGSVKVTDRVTHVCSVGQGVSSFMLHNDGSGVVYIGSETVTPTGELMGMPLASGEKHDFTTYDSDVIDVYAVTAPGEVATLAFLVSS